MEGRVVGRKMMWKEREKQVHPKSDQTGRSAKLDKRQKKTDGS